MNYLRTFRPINLSIIILAMLGVRYGVIETLLAPLFLAPSFKLFSFILLLIAVVLMAAAGNLINDYFDQKADAENKPGKNLIGNKISEKNALIIYWILTLISLLISAFLCFQIGSLALFILHVFVSISLWYYSKILQHQWLIGNFIVALLCALVLLLPIFYEIISRSRDGFWTSIVVVLNNGVELDAGLFNRVLLFSTSVMAVFAFLITMSRELLKDLADIKGDRLIGSASFPIHFGILPSKQLIYVFNTLSILLLFLFFEKYMIDLLDKSAIFWMSILLFGGIVSPLIISSVICHKAADRSSYLKAAQWNKLSMLIGVLIPFLFKLFY